MIHASTDLLEFDALKALLARYVSSPGGRAKLAGLAPCENRAALEPALAEADEAIAYLRAAAQPQPAALGAAIRLRFDLLPDLAPHIAKLRIEGAVLEGREILELESTLQRACDMRAILSAVAGRFPLLAARAARIGDFRGLLRDLAGKILPDGTVADHASVALAHLRRDLERQQRLIQESLERFLGVHRDDGVVQEDFITIRNDRFVVPIVAGRQGRVDGVIHGSSGSGHTMFVEPLETIELNNDLVRLKEDEIREVHRILQEITNRFRDAGAAVSDTIEAVAELELIFGKAAFAVDFGGVIPRFSPPEAPRLRLRAARHPLLEDVLRRHHVPIVPISLALEGDTRTLLVSGPNTGGKTVTLKTVGLLALMAQSGLPVPCEEAEFPLFAQVLADMGDNQSIEESLSTFSAHVARIREMLEALGADSLVLLDELGRATDPDEGGALGIAILEHIRRLGSFTLASTHLLAPKIYGATTPGVLNASLSFDEETLRPTYELRIGAPGKSAGIDIAQRLGLPAPVIEHARASLSGRQQDIARFLSLLEQRLADAENAGEQLRRQQRVLEEEERSLAKKWEQRERTRMAELERRWAEMAAQFESRAQETIDRIAQSAEQKRFTAQSERRLAQAKRELREGFEAAVLERREPPPRAGRVVEGARVRLKDVREPARVRRLLPHGLIEVEAGLVKMQVPADDVLEVLPEGPAARKIPADVTLRTGPEFLVRSREINVIGKHAEEACQEVDKFLDNAVLASVSRVRIVHGHGMGILRKAIAQLLTNHPHVEKFYPASPEEGGAGATIAELRES